MNKKLLGWHYYISIIATITLWVVFTYRIALEERYHSPSLIWITLLFATLNIIFFVFVPIKRLRKYGDFIATFKPHKRIFIFHVSLSLISFIIFIWGTFYEFDYKFIQGGVLCIIFPYILNMNVCYFAPVIATSKGILQGFFFSSWDNLKDFSCTSNDVKLTGVLNRSDSKHTFTFNANETQITALEALINNNTTIIS